MQLRRELAASFHENVTILSPANLWSILFLLPLCGEIKLCVEVEQIKKKLERSCKDKSAFSTRFLQLTQVCHERHAIGSSIWHNSPTSQTHKHVRRPRYVRQVQKGRIYIPRADDVYNVLLPNDLFVFIPTWR